MELKAYLEQALKSFEGHPPDSSFQRGYLAAIIEISRVFHPEIPVVKVEAHTIAPQPN